MRKKAKFLLAVAVFTLIPALFYFWVISHLSQEVYTYASLRRAHSSTIYNKLPGIEFNCTERNFENRPVEVGVLKVNLGRGIEAVVMVNNEFNGRLYANRKEDTLEFINADDELENSGLNQMNIQRREMQTVEEFIAEYERSHPDKEVMAAVTAANVLWNDWFVALAGDEIYHRLGEPIYDRKYSVLVIRKDSKVSIENVEFKENAGGPRVIDSQGTDITDEVEYLTFGQHILKDSKARNLADISYQWDDLRHLIAFPRLVIKNAGLLYDEFLFGQNQLLSDPRLLNDALSDKVIEVSADTLEENMKKAGIVKSVPEFLKENLSGYVEVSDASNIEAGQYYIESSGIVKIRFKRGPFSHIAIGITEDNEIVTVSVGLLTKGGGATIEEVAGLLQEQGAVNGLLLCNGMDVVTYLGNQRSFSAEKDVWGTRYEFSSVILFVGDKN